MSSVRRRISPVATLPLITVDGSFTDWASSELIATPANAVPGYALYGTVQNDTYFIGIDATLATDAVIGAGTTVWLNTDQNTATGYSPFGSVGAEYNVTYVGGSFYLYTGASAQNLVSPTPLTTALSADGRSLEIAIPRRPTSTWTRRSTPAPHHSSSSPPITLGRNSRSSIPRPVLTGSLSSTLTPAPTCISIRLPIPICSWRRRTKPAWPACRTTSSMNRN
jgi:hypothetical protein